MQNLSLARRLTPALLLVAVFAHADAPANRSIELTYTATIGVVPPGAQTIDLWLPIAQDTDGQKVSRYEIVYPEGGEVNVEPEYGNQIWHKRFNAPFDADLRDGTLGAQLVFEIHRTEIVVTEAKNLDDTPSLMTTLSKYLEPNRLVPVDTDPITEISRELALVGQPPIVAARRVYDWLIDEFTYNWTDPNAGEGDVRWACDSRMGDCSDYHSMFLAICRNAGIPADHEFGFPIRVSGTSGRIPSYHCWARFHVEGIGWIPLDASEADKNPKIRDYNFGSQSANLFKFTHGRDITLAPPQQGPALNYFIHPYVEIDGAPHDDVEYTVLFKDIAAE